jgi:hypothetical protein
MCKNICCWILIVFLLLILISVIKTRVTEYYEQIDPMLVRIKETLIPLHPCVSSLKFYEGKKSYTINKKKIYLCLKDENGEYYDFNMLMYVSIHELSHVICDEIGHTQKFHRIFRNMLELAEQKNIYDSSIPIIKNYCGHN